MQQRIFGLDIIRAAAISGVMVAHYGLFFAYVRHSEAPAWLLAPGFYGVELFFALSGFLIGNILFDIADRGFTLNALYRFWIRRWLRTIPCYWVVLVLTVCVANINGEHDYNLLPFITLTQNFIAPSATDFYGVSWSLTIEEWFYILFPIGLFLSLAVLPKQGTLAAIALFLVLPVVGRHIGWTSLHLPWDAGIRKIVLLQLDAIAYGAMAAYLSRGRNVSAGLSVLLGVAGAFTLALSCWMLVARRDLSDVLASNVIFMSASMGSALIVTAFANLNRTLKSITAPVQFLSKHSYTLYLIHVPAFTLVAHYLYLAGALDWAPVIGAILSLASAALLTRFIEVPIMRARPSQFGEARETKKHLVYEVRAVDAKY